MMVITNNMENYTELEKRYLIKERVQEKILEHGSIEKAIKYLEAELNGFENYWSSCSYDCVGHAITCNRLLVSRLKELL